MAPKPLNGTKECVWEVLQVFRFEEAYVISLVQTCAKYFVFLAKHGVTFTCKYFVDLSDAEDFFSSKMMALVKRMKKGEKK